jgi:pyruvate ferredoxin oxidoreductase delta subunit
VRVENPMSWKLPLSRPAKGVAGKTGLWRTLKPVVDLNKCTKCYQCEIFCPAMSIVVEPERGAIVDYEYCKGCGICSDVCPTGAIQMVPERG